MLTQLSMLKHYQYFKIYKENKFHAQMSWAWKKFYNLGACPKSHLGICSQLIHSVVSNDSVSGQGRLRSDCTDVQADLSLRCPHMLVDMFSHGADKV